MIRKTVNILVLLQHTVKSPKEFEFPLYKMYLYTIIFQLNGYIGYVFILANITRQTPTCQQHPAGRSLNFATCDEVNRFCSH